VTERVDPQWAASELETQHEFLDYQRASLLMKVRGLDDEQARRRSCPPSTLNLLGLVRHMAKVERIWFQECFAGRGDLPRLYSTREDPDRDLHPSASDSLEEAIATLEAEIVVSKQLSIDAPADQLSAAARTDGHPNLRWILAHMIEEYARHLGHADLLRQAVDGNVDD
jgi:uncharacterized damage-inducible protein DinB